MSEWVPDILGEGFERSDLDLGSDPGSGGGPLVATLVRALPRPRGIWSRILGRGRLLEEVDVLYVHGWSDYFFQRGMARFFTERGARFFALDLRRYGRSLRDGQAPGYIERLDDYDAEIGAALAAMGHGVAGSWPGAGTGADAGEDPAPAPAPSGGRGPSRRLVLFGHSTGGLILSLWADRHPGVAAALLLNSPWLELQLSGAGRRAIAPVVNLRARLAPQEPALPQLDLGFYHRAQSLVSDPEEQALVESAWRPAQTQTVRAGWLSAILAGQARVSTGLEVGAPSCVLLSARSQFGLTWRDEMTRADTVLDVDSIAAAALRLGRTVTIERIDGALHDVFLSAEEVRAEAYARLERWLTGWAATTGRPGRPPAAFAPPSAG